MEKQGELADRLYQKGEVEALIKQATEQAVKESVESGFDHILSGVGGEDEGAYRREVATEAFKIMLAAGLRIPVNEDPAKAIALRAWGFAEAMDAERVKREEPEPDTKVLNVGA